MPQARRCCWLLWALCITACTWAPQRPAARVLVDPPRVTSTTAPSQPSSVPHPTADSARPSSPPTATSTPLATPPSPTRTPPAPTATLAPLPWVATSPIVADEVIAWIEKPTASVRVYQHEFGPHASDRFGNPLLPIYQRDLLAVTRSGEQRRIAHHVRAVIPRAHQLPLIITEAAPGSLRLVDPETHTTRRLHVGPHTLVVPTFALSPDERQIAFATRRADCAEDWCNDHIMTADVRSGQTHVLVQGALLGVPVVWSTRGIYCFVPDVLEDWHGALVLVDLTSGKPQSRQIADSVYRGSFQIHRDADLLSAFEALVDIKTGQQDTIGQPYAIDSTAIAPDAQRVAYVYRDDDALTNPTVMMYDRAQHHAVLWFRGVLGDLSWSHDGSLLLLSGGIPKNNVVDSTHVVVFRTDTGQVVDHIINTLDIDDAQLTHRRELIGLVRDNDRWMLMIQPLQSHQQHTIALSDTIPHVQNEHVGFYSRYNRPTLVYVP